MRRSWQAISLMLVGAVHVEMGIAMKMTKERLAGAIKVGFAQWRVDYTDFSVPIEDRRSPAGATGGTPVAPGLWYNTWR